MTDTIEPQVGHITIEQVIDGHEADVREEIEALEAQLGEKRIRLDRLGKLRGLAEQLESPDGEPAVLDGIPGDASALADYVSGHLGAKAARSAAAKSEGGGISAPATPPRPKPAKPKGKANLQVSVTDKKAPFHQQVLEHVQQHPGCTGADVARAFGIPDAKGQAKSGTALNRLYREEKLSFEKVGTSKRWEVADRPKSAPEHERRAAPAPDDEPTEPRLPARREAKVDRTPAKKKHDTTRERIFAVALELIADEEPIARDDLVKLIVERIEGVTEREITNALIQLATKRKVERWADGYHLPGRNKEGAITQAEKDAVACLGSGCTAKEVAVNCESIANATNATAILEGLVRRNVIRRRPNSSPMVFEAPEVAHA